MTYEQEEIETNMSEDKKHKNTEENNEGQRNEKTEQRTLVDLIGGCRKQTVETTITNTWARQYLHNRDSDNQGNGLEGKDRQHCARHTEQSQGLEGTHKDSGLFYFTQPRNRNRPG